MTQIKKQRKFILFAIIGLTLFGSLMVYESSSLYAHKTFGDPAHFFKRQILFLFMGLVLFFAALFIDLDFLKKYNKELLISVIIVLLIILFMGKKSGGARRWLFLGGFYFQPSELLKIFFLFYCADYFRRKGNLIKNFKIGLLPLGFILGAICLLLILQPDLGTAVFWVFWMLLFLFICGARKKHLVLIIVLGLVASFFLIKFYPYRFRRITAYLNPFSDPKGAGFQLIQSQIAYGEGGILGVGFGEGRQKLFFLPAAHTDFVFSIIAEEFGFWGVQIVLILFFLVFHKMAGISKMADDRFKRTILWGITLMFTLEVVINVSVSCGLLPTTGLSLPFISYGGSNLITHYILLGLFFNASRTDAIARQPTSKTNNKSLITDN
jgi:cell division protein FtsW